MPGACARCFISRDASLASSKIRPPIAREPGHCPTSTPNKLIRLPLDPASRTGRRAGPAVGHDAPGAVGVLSEVEAMPIDIVYPVGLVEHLKGPAQTFRLVVNKTELLWLWACIRRWFG
jgi:hypothetical protein